MESSIQTIRFQIQMQLRVFDEKKRTQYKFKENEGLQFAFDVDQDKSEEVVQQMIEQQHIPDVDTKMIIKLIKDKVEAFKRDREYRHIEIKRQKEEEARKQEEQAVKIELAARRAAVEQQHRQAEEQQKRHAAEAQQLQQRQAAEVNATVEQPKPEATTTVSEVSESHPPTTIAQVTPVINKLESQLSEEQITIQGNQSTVTSTASGVRRAKKKIVLEVLNVAYAEGTDQPVSSSIFNAILLLFS